MEPFFFISVMAALYAFVSPAGRWGLPTAAPEEVGLSPEGLDVVTSTLQRHVDENRIAGLVAMIARKGKVGYLEALGMQDIEAGRPMEKDSIFRIYSMTKPIASTALMMLYEERLFGLDDPVSDYLPQLGGLAVAVEETEGGTGETTLHTVPANRDMTVRDLLRHTAGLSYGIFAESEVDRLYRQAGVLKSRDLAEMVEKLGKLPLKHQPGEAWEYSVATDVVGRLVEVLSDVRFDLYLRGRIFEPLGMLDTGFNVPEHKTNRFAAVYTPNEDMTLRSGGDVETYWEYFKPAKFFSGGGGLVSTASDYVRFCQMLLNGGELEGARLLQPQTVGLMTQDHLGEIPRGDGAGDVGFGLGFAVVVHAGRGDSPDSVGTYRWGGAAHTRFWIDPVKELIGIFLVQIMPDVDLPYGDEFKAMAYES
ncbi:MAG: serine hydrolase domain-containing protein, partial [Planctomycetota bacterium]